MHVTALTAINVFIGITKRSGNTYVTMTNTYLYVTMTNTYY